MIPSHTGYLTMGCKLGEWRAQLTNHCQSQLGRGSETRCGLCCAAETLAPCSGLYNVTAGPARVQCR